MDYKIALEATVNSQSLAKAVKDRIAELDSQGVTTIKFKTAIDSKGLEKVTLGYETEMGKVTEKISETESGLTNVKTLTGQVGKETGFWDSWLGKAALSITRYVVLLGGAYRVVQQISDGFEYIAQLNKEMTNIQVLQANGAQTDKQIKALSQDFNQLAQEMGATTLEVAKGSVEWLRQGKTVQETGELLKSTLMLAKLGNMDTASSTEKLTAVINGFGMQTSDAVTVVSKLVAIDNIAATSVDELSTAMQYSSAVAKESGVSFDNLAAYIGTVSSRTRLSAEMIGTAFRSMFVRMQQVRFLPKHMVTYGLI